MGPHYPNQSSAGMGSGHGPSLAGGIARDSQVRSAMATLNNRIASVLGRIDALTDRLDPILRPEPSAQPERDAPHTTPPMCTHGLALENMAVELSRIETRLQNIQERLEL